MNIETKTKRKLLLSYFIVCTLLFIVLQIGASDQARRIAPIFYAFFCPIFFFGIRINLVFKISSYVETKYPDLMKKNLIGSNGFRGETINLFGINRKEFLAKNDNLMDDMIETHLLLIKLVLVSFFTLIVVSIFGLNFGTVL